MKGGMLRATALMSSTALISLILNLIKGKVFAILLGVNGMGIYGIFLSVLGIGASLGGISTGGSVVKELSGIINEKKENVQIFKKAIFALSTFISILLFLGVIVCRHLISEFINYNLSVIDVIFIGLAIIFSNFSTLQLSWLNSFSQLKGIAVVKTFSAFVTVILSILALWLLGIKSLPLLLLLPTLLAFINGLFIRAKGIDLPVQAESKLFSKKVYEYQWKVLKVGFLLMLSSLFASVVNLAVRLILESDFGMASVGLFQSAWSVSMAYIEILLASVSVYFFPVLIKKVKSLDEATKHINDQIEQLLLICIPVILGTFVCASLVLHLLFDKSFIGAEDILRWQLLGDMFKICVWVFGFVIIAYNKLLVALVLQLFWGGTYVLGVYLSESIIGIESSGFGFFISYFLTFIAYIIYMRKVLKIKFDSYNHILLYTGFIAAIIIFLLFMNYGKNFSIFCGLILVTASVVFSFRELNKKNVTIQPY